MTISPLDARVAARSFPRRWRSLFATAAGDADMTDVLQRSGAEDLAAQAAEVLEHTADQLRGGLDAPAVDDVLARVEASAEHLAASIDAVDPDDWKGPRIDALDAGIAQAASLLRDAEKAIEAARSER
jgi:hypothetical protein